jgi:adenosylcobyric acid synthase
VTTQSEGVISNNEGMLEGLKDITVTGYEIHMGTTEYGEGCVPFITIKKVLDKEENYVDGIRNADGSVFGTYMHGVFDNMSFTKGFINNLRRKKGLETLKDSEDMDFKTFKDQQYDKLSEMLRANLDMKKIYEIVGLK